MLNKIRKVVFWPLEVFCRFVDPKLPVIPALQGMGIWMLVIICVAWCVLFTTIPQVTHAPWVFIAIPVMMVGARWARKHTDLG